MLLTVLSTSLLLKVTSAPLTVRPSVLKEKGQAVLKEELTTLPT